ncbi:TPA: aldo/keto reductase, partial [Streptococcus agalactiae]
IEANLDIFDFQLNEDDIATLIQLDSGIKPKDPDNVSF